METTEGYDTAVWTQMADQLGLQSLTIPEEFGGSGFSYVELIVVLEEMGAALLCAPFFSTVAPGGQRHPHLRRPEGEGRPAARHRRRGRPSPPWPIPRTAGDGTPKGDPDRHPVAATGGR